MTERSLVVSGESVTDNPDAGCEPRGDQSVICVNSASDEEGSPEFQSVDTIGRGASSTRLITWGEDGNPATPVDLADRLSILTGRRPENWASISCLRFAFPSTTSTRCLIK